MAIMIDNFVKDVVSELLETNSSTWNFNFEIHEEFTEARDALHESIIGQILSRNEYSREKRVFMLGGATANGKTSFLNSGLRVYPPYALMIDPDEIKDMLPEYQYMVATNEVSAASRVHEESSVIAKEIRRIAIAGGYDILLDGIANDTLERRTADVLDLKSNGHTVVIDYVTLDTRLSLDNAEERYKRTKRFVPREVILEKNRMVAALVPQLIEKQIFDELYLWDTNVKGKPRLILSQKNGILYVENSDLYENFKNKAHETDGERESGYTSK